MTGGTLTHPQDIVHEFASYKTLYAPETPANPDQIEAFLSGIRLPSLADEGRKLLEGEITTLEITQAISKLPYHKAPGEDSFPSEYYKWTGEEVAAFLSASFKEVEQVGSLGPISIER